MHHSAGTADFELLDGIQKTTRDLRVHSRN